MRLTVGPLPPAVYWRRRAVVLGAGLLFLIVLLYSCTNTKRNNTGAAGAGPTGTASATAAPEPTGTVLTPKSGSPAPTPEESSSGSDGGSDGGQGGPAGGGTGTNDTSVAPVVDNGTCTDSEILVTPVALPATAQRGTVVTLRLKVKNVSERTCSRDVGADLQELFVKVGADRVWSSDTCGTGRGSAMQSFTPKFERYWELGWNSRYSNRCANGLAAGEFVPAGSYQVFARVGTKISNPVKLTITN
ncbi:hypothetical protein [Micromonospora sp. NPDC093277]|uniref:hypothetical protein n=1 Tax=Micromonospora sp. NPDC093277 TaxID=3364291 RepID=UPI00382391EB